MSVLISCEVGGELVPPPLIAAAPHKPKDAVSKRSRGKLLVPGRLPATLSSDESASYAAARMADQLHARLIANDYSLDLIDVTRSLHHRQLFPLMTRKWPTEDRRRLIDLIYEPYRQRVRKTIRNMLARSAYVIHLSVSTFELRCKGKIRRADAGLLYDPARDDEVDTCLDWIDEMYDEVPMVRVRRNYPRRGTSDSITKAMRAEFADQNYIGIELMLNRAWVGREVAVRRQAIDGICWSLQVITETSQSMAG